MSQRLISRSPDLKRLRDEGYELEVRVGFVLIKHVPYVTPGCAIDYGTLVSDLELANDVTVKPANHVAMFAGQVPCDEDGQPLTKIINSSGRQALGDGIAIDHTFSSKPVGGYADYHHKMTTYVSMISGPARALDENVTATTFPLIEDEDEESVFNYFDTASSRATISAVSEKLRLGEIAIVGLGGTGSYVLDLVAKTPIREIHLFDGDRFLQHNAFRSPGAASGIDLDKHLSKVEHFARMYSAMRRNIVPHAYYIDESNIHELRGMDFVFVAMDRGEAKGLVVRKLQEFGVPFIEVGMGIYETNGSLGGLLRTTVSTQTKSDHVSERIPFTDGDVNNEYSQNIQIAELNSLHAALAVIKWKKLVGFYQDLGKEHHSVYAITDNCLINEDRA